MRTGLRAPRGVVVRRGGVLRGVRSGSRQRKDLWAAAAIVRDLKLGGAVAGSLRRKRNGDRVRPALEYGDGRAAGGDDKIGSIGSDQVDPADFQGTRAVVRDDHRPGAAGGS